MIEALGAEEGRKALCASVLIGVLTCGGFDAATAAAIGMDVGVVGRGGRDLLLNVPL